MFVSEKFNGASARNSGAFNRHGTLTALGLLFYLGVTAAAAQQPGNDNGETTLDAIVVTAEQQLKQAPGVSTVTAEDIQKMPPANDISEILRKMPGANLTGTTASGQRGNQRQIELRGMGPEKYADPDRRKTGAVT